jgi:hypothetical protein
MNFEQDPEITQIREVRMRISEKFNHDPDLLAKHYQELQKRHQDRLVFAPAICRAECAAELLTSKNRQ